MTAARLVALLALVLLGCVRMSSATSKGYAPPPPSFCVYDPDARPLYVKWYGRRWRLRGLRFNPCGMETLALGDSFYFVRACSTVCGWMTPGGKWPTQKGSWLDTIPGWGLKEGRNETDEAHRVTRRWH